MAKPILIKVKGIKQTQRFLKLQSATKLSRLNEAIHKQGFKLQGEVQDSIAGHKSEVKSVDTGQFLNSITTDNSQKLVSQVLSNVEYAPYLEKGTRKIKARKHFEMSKSRRESNIQRAIKEAIR